jgi:hypothetical protein
MKPFWVNVNPKVKVFMGQGPYGSRYLWVNVPMGQGTYGSRLLRVTVPMGQGSRDSGLLRVNFLKVKIHQGHGS